MIYTKALYYPWIDISDENWLKSALLYWDTIQTIVPESIENPYSTQTAKVLKDAGVLVPLRVSPRMQEVQNLAPDIARYLNDPATLEMFAGSASQRHVYLHPDKLPAAVKEFANIHPDKLPQSISQVLGKSGILKGKSEDFFTVDSRFADFYMTILATRLSERVNASLLTNATTNDKLAFNVKVDSKITRRSLAQRRNDLEYSASRPRRYAPSTLAQGMLAELIMEKVKVDSSTPVEKLLRFRQDYSSELGNFREKLGSLTSSISSDLPIENLRQRVNDIYYVEVVPAINNLKQGLSSNGIRWFTDNYVKIAFLSTSTTSTLAVLGLSVPHALLASGVVSLTTSAILYNLDKERTLQENPFSYVLSAEQEFRH